MYRNVRCRSQLETSRNVLGGPRRARRRERPNRSAGLTPCSSVRLPAWNDVYLLRFESHVLSRTRGLILTNRLGLQEEKIGQLHVAVGRKEGLEERFQASEERASRLSAEVDEYRNRFADVQRDLETMRSSVERELQEGREAHEQNKRLRDEVELLRATASPRSSFPNGFSPMASLRSSNRDASSSDEESTRTVPPPPGANGTGVPAYYSARYGNLGVGASMQAPKPLRPQATGASVATIRSAVPSRYAPSPTPSRISKASKASDGWWG
jgi:hypothetical protein